MKVRYSLNSSGETERFRDSNGSLIILIGDVISQRAAIAIGGGKHPAAAANWQQLVLQPGRSEYLLGVWHPEYQFRGDLLSKL